MAVIFYQLAILATLIATRVFFPKRLLTVAVVWTGLTLFNLFFPPLIILQLVVIWAGYSFIRPRAPGSPQPIANAEKAIDFEALPATHIAPTAREDEILDEILARPVSSRQRVTLGSVMKAIESAEPTWLNTEKLGRFKAGVLGNLTTDDAIPVLFALDFVNDPESFKRVISRAAVSEAGGASFEQQQHDGEKVIREAWAGLPADKKQKYQAQHDLLKGLKF